jgi:RNA polymerase sigma-70 factor (ECF subfamily)
VAERIHEKFREDAELVAQIAGAGPDAAAAERAFCERFAPRVRRYAERHLRVAGAAADLTQEVLMIALEAMREGRVEKPERLGSFVLSTCRHRVWSDNRAQARRRDLDGAALPVALPTFDVSARDRLRLEECVGKLGDRERTVVLLTYYEEWPAARIATSLDTTAGNVRVIRHRSLAQLARCLEAPPGRARA